MEVQMISLSAFGFAGCLYRPSAGVDMAVIVLSGSDGRLEHAQYIARLLADSGLTALALAYFKYPGLGKTLRLIPLEYIENALAWLKTNTEATQYGIYGVSKGAEYALSAAAHFPELSRVVAVVPNYYVGEGIGKGKSGAGVSSWSYKRQPLPYTPLPGKIIPFIKRSVQHREPRIATFYELAKERGIPEQAMIPVENAHADILLLSSGLDSIWPSAAAGEMICERLRTARYGYRCQHKCYEHASHVLDPVSAERARQLRKLMWAERRYPDECRLAREDALSLSKDWFAASAT